MSAETSSARSGSPSDHCRRKSISSASLDCKLVSGRALSTFDITSILAEGEVDSEEKRKKQGPAAFSNRALASTGLGATESGSSPPPRGRFVRPTLYVISF